MLTSKIKTFPPAKICRIVNRSPYTDYIAEDDFCDNGCGLFAILDGHGGAEVSEFCASALPNVLSRLFSSSNKNTKQIKTT